MTDYTQRLEELRIFMRSRDLDAVIIYSTDPHFSEYPADRWKQVEWLCGFTGEAGDLAITLDDAGLWTDSRYFIQAEQQLVGTGVALHKSRIPGAESIEDWLIKKVGEGASVAVDSRCTSIAAYRELQESFELVGIPDLLSVLWTDRPSIPQTPVYSINPGESREEKMDWLRALLADKACDYILVSELDQIAWMLNLRASDIEYNPLVISYLLIGQDDAKFYVIKDEYEDSVSEYTFEMLQSEGIEILLYEELAMDLLALEGARVWIDENSLNAELYSSLHCEIHSAPSPIPERKAVKNPLEIENIKDAHIRDGAAMENFLYWLEKRMTSGERVSEWDAACKLGEFRSQIEDYVEDSFETISAYGPSAALPHYHTPSGDAPLLEPSGLYLNDSGGQFSSGTTDITRTVPLGECTPEQRREYSLVLKAHIDLAAAVFPVGTPGCRIDAAARLSLWKHHLDFGHGTGHGVGYFLGVHEGPAQIRQNLGAAPLKDGMISSIEPGIYREGMYGVRHENLYLVENAGRSEFGEFLRFEALTMCHFDTSILELECFEDWEIDWLNAYHQRVYDNVGPLLDQEVLEWLRKKTAPIVK
ncbi:MAG: aminopeptidase P family protein [Candidatus Cryptobacteroides sp.]